MDFLRTIQTVVPGAQGRVLAVLVETTAKLNLRTIAQLSGVSQAQASRVLSRLVGIGVVERQEVPPSSLFRLVPEHLAARAILDLSRSIDSALSEIGRAAGDLPIPPVSVIVFGSLARREAGTDSDIDTVVVRPTDVSEDDETWGASIEEWRSEIRRLTGNRVEVLELDTDETVSCLNEGNELWASIRREGLVVYGISLDELMAT